jgi:chemotaxis protein MotB
MARKKLKRPEGPSGPKGAPKWVVTFTDMVSLLVTFFVLMMTFSSLNEDELRKVASSLTGQGGALASSENSMPESPQHDLMSATDILRGARMPHSRPSEKLPENLEEMGQKKTERDQEVDLSRVADGLVIEFGPDASFLPGSAEPTLELARSLRELGEVLENYQHLVVVEGFTDGAFRATSDYPDSDALAFDRAQNAAAAMLRSSTMAPELIQLSSNGDRAPRASDATPEGRQLNRRVQVRILSLSRLRATYLNSLVPDEPEEG